MTKCNTLHILNVYFDKTQQHRFLCTFKETGGPATEGGGGDAEEDTLGGTQNPHSTSQARDDTTAFGAV